MAWAICLPAPSAALSTPSSLESLEETDREALERLATQPAPLRESALLATQHVDALVEVQRIQEQSSADFQERIAELDRGTQEQLWEMVREPGLLEELAGSGPRSAAQLDAIAAKHPEALAPAIQALGTEHTLLLGHVLSIQRRANERFELLIRDIPDDASRQAFRDLLEQPELLSLLARRVHLVVRLGDSFRDDPDATRAHLAALGEEVAANDARARDQWVQSIADDPDAAQELEESARAYCEEYGCDYDELTEPDVRTRIEIVVHPYPFWFGYPYWYADAYLFPYGYWYHYPPHFGFYHHLHHHRYVWFGLPSIHFAHWFFSGHHYGHYSHLSYRFDRHYGRHRHVGSVFHHTLGNWVRWRDRDHHHSSAGRGKHRARHGDGGRRTSGGRNGGLFASLFEEARFQAGTRHATRREREPRVRDGDGRRLEGRDRNRGGGGRVAAPAPSRDDRDAQPRGRDGDRRDRAERGNREGQDRGDRADRGDVSRDSSGNRGDRAEQRDRRGDRDRDRSTPGRGGQREHHAARPDSRRERPQVRIRDFRTEADAGREDSSAQRRDRDSPRRHRKGGMSFSGRDRGPSAHRGSSGGSRSRSWSSHRGSSGGSRGRGHHAGGRGGGGGGHRGGVRR
jgi:hypothetical protein